MKHDYEHIVRMLIFSTPGTVQQRLCLIARVVVRYAVSPCAFSLHSSSGKGLCLATIQVGGMHEPVMSRDER